MAKKSMQLKYKSRKRQRNKYNPNVSKKDEAKSFLVTLGGVLVFLAVMYLIVFGMEKIGLFQMGYTAPNKEATEFDYERIPVGTVFNRSDNTYYVLFDDYSTRLSSDPYINLLVKKSGIKAYTVDMSLSENSKYKGEKENRKASNVSELSINDITLIKIVNGRITDYKVGTEEIEEYLEK